VKFSKGKLALSVILTFLYSPLLLFQGCGTIQKYEKFNKTEKNIFSATSIDLANITGSVYDTGSSPDGKIDMSPIMYIMYLPGYTIDIIPSLAVDIVTAPYDIYTTLKYKRDIGFWNNVASNSLYDLPQEEYLSHVSEHYVGNFNNYYNDRHILRDIPDSRAFNKKLVETITNEDSNIKDVGGIPFFILYDPETDTETLQLLVDNDLPFNFLSFLNHKNSTYEQRSQILRKKIVNGNFGHYDYQLLEGKFITEKDLAKIIKESMIRDTCSEKLLGHIRYKMPNTLTYIWPEICDYYKVKKNDNFWSFTSLFREMPLPDGILNEAFPFSDKDNIKQYLEWREDIGDRVFNSHYLKERVYCCVNILNNPHTPESFKKEIASQFENIALLPIKILTYSSLKKYLSDKSIPEQLAEKLYNLVDKTDKRGYYTLTFPHISVNEILKNPDLDKGVAKAIMDKLPNLKLY